MTTKCVGKTKKDHGVINRDKHVVSVPSRDTTPLSLYIHTTFRTVTLCHESWLFVH